MMNNRLIVLVCLYIHALFQTANSQPREINVPIPPSPNSASLMEYVNIPVSNYTGTAQIDVPLFDLKTKQSSVPINLSYHASGIKVQDIASQVGLGWSLNAGGVITRVVRGRPDFTNAFCVDLSDKFFYNAMLYGSCDTQPDVFYFNFLGRSGKFVFDKEGNPYMIPYQNYRIKPGIGPNAESYWTIIDDSGYQFIFGEAESQIEYTVSENMYNGAYIGGNNLERFISTWYLSKIIDPNGFVEANFQYQNSNGLNIEYEYYSESISKITDQTGGSCTPQNDTRYDTNTKIIIENPKYVSSITSDYGTATFLYESGRKDLQGGRFLREFTVYNADNELIKKYTFEYTYFDGAYTFLGPYNIYLNPPYTLPETCKDCFRLKLTQIKQDETLTYRRFEYNQNVDLPPRYSVFEDHWGYFNGRNNMYSWGGHVGYSSKIPEYLSYAGANKDPYFPSAEANILKRIFYPTGGFSELVYEANGGSAGIRVKQITDFSLTGSNIQRTFNYYDPQYYVSPVYSYVSSGITGQVQYSFFKGFITISQTCGATYHHVKSSSFNNILDLSGASVGYGRVSVFTNGNQREDYYYSNFDAHPDIAPEVFYDVRNEGDILLPGLPVDVNGPPFAPYSSIYWERGNLEKIEQFANQNGQYKIVDRKIFDYYYNLDLIKEISGFTVTSFISTRNAVTGSFNPIYHFGKYKFISKPFLSKKTIHEVFDQSDPGNESKKLTSSTEYFYNRPGQSTVVLDLKPRKAVNILPNGERIIEEKKYLLDYFTSRVASDPPVRALFLMKSKKIEGAPIEGITYLEKQNGATLSKFILDGFLLKYKEFSTDKVYLDEVWKFKAGIGSAFENYNWSSTENPQNNFVWPNSNNFKITSSAIGYDSYGNLSSYTKSDGIQTDIGWGGVNSSLLISTTQNTGSYQHKTSYSHKPLVGILKLTDANNRESKYEYDKSTRLRIVRDHSNQIVARYRYHYKDQPEQLNNSSVSTGACREVGQPVSFSSSESAEYGQTTYYWDFGNGNTGTTSTGSTTHTYTQPGTYQVQVRKENPEYLSITAATSVTISYGLTGVTICADGPVILDNCNSSNADFGSCTVNNQYVYSPTIFTANHSGTASSYLWEYRFNGGNWTAFGYSSQVYAPPGFYYGGVTGQYEVRCTVQSECGTPFVSSSEYLILFQSGPGPCEQY